MTSEIEHDLRAASDGMLATLEQLEKLETEKRSLAPDSERFQRLAAEIERLAAVVFAQTRAQQKLAERSQVMAERTGAVLPPIEAMSGARDIPAILADWRAAERTLADFDDDSAERAQAAADIRRLRDEYQRAYSAEASREQRQEA